MYESGYKWVISTLKASTTGIYRLQDAKSTSENYGRVRAVPGAERKTLPSLSIHPDKTRFIYSQAGDGSIFGEKNPYSAYRLYPQETPNCNYSPR